MAEQRPDQWAKAVHKRLADPIRPGTVRDLDFCAGVTGDALTDSEVIGILRGQLNVRLMAHPDESLTPQDLVEAFRAGFRSRRMGPDLDAEALKRRRTIREGHHLQRASFRSGAWFYDEIFPDHVVKGAKVEVYGFRARVQRLRLGLPEGQSSSRGSRDGRYAYVAFQVGGVGPLDLLCATPRAEWVPFSELCIVEQSSGLAGVQGCRSCGADSCSAVDVSALPAGRGGEVGPQRCGCCGTPWTGTQR